MHKVNAGLTLLVPVVADRLAALEALLVELNQHQERLPFEPSATTHFATITTFPATKWNEDPLGPILLFATSYSGPTDVHVRELVEVMGDGLRTIFAHCEDFERDMSDDGLVAWMLERDRHTTFYSGMNHLSRADVLNNKKLREVIGDFLDTRDDAQSDPMKLRKAIQDHVDSRGDLAWTREPWKPTLRAQLVFYWRSLVMEGVFAALLVCTALWAILGGTALEVICKVGWGALGAFIVFIAILVINVRIGESKQRYLSSRPADERARLLASTQMRPVINEFTLGCAIKEEGEFRPLLLSIGLWVIARYSDGFPGLMSGIRIPTVATARWITCDGGRRLLFISNYTNDGVGYVRDFIETKSGAQNINISFGFGRGFPKTRWVYKDGSYTDPNTYLDSLAENQHVTQFWYGPYHDLSIDNIRRDRAIREGLFGEKDLAETKKWLQLL